MRRGDAADEAIGKAAFSIEMDKARIEPVEGAECRMIRIDEDGKAGRRRILDAQAFRALGIGMDEAVFFTARDAEEEERLARSPLFVVSAIGFDATLPKTRIHEDREEAVRAVVKFILRIPEEERAATWERMKAFGGGWKR